ncbi:adenine phosphoribosyltransferase [Prochlorococcus marinus]|uniref:adenine phosphoribosyltransferase n=1 Tax=Prochlorococcus marinus TaxID=1219 RepID=UPI0022B5070D|nr:adenine phosphoribosyltransferase [Prochlorococcus marinus]
MENLKKYINEIKDFPKEGIIFKDINPIYKDPKRWNELMLPLQKLISISKPDYIAGIESRGFISASALAFKLELGFIPIRKPNKLPGRVIGINYKLEYGEDRLEIQQNSFEKESKIIVIDDLLATGGTASAAGKLITKAGGNLIGYAFLVELTKLNGRNNLDCKLLVESLIKY